MTDEAWKALAIILPSLFGFLAVLFAKQARDQGKETAQKVEENTERLVSHEETAAEHSRALKTELAAERRLRPPAPESDVRER